MVTDAPCKIFATKYVFRSNLDFLVMVNVSKYASPMHPMGMEVYFMSPSQTDVVVEVRINGEQIQWITSHLLTQLKTDMTMENPPFQYMYFLFNMGMFQPVLDLPPIH